MTTLPSIELADRQHARCSASAASRWIACPGSVGLAEAITERFGLQNLPTIYSARGSFLHAAAERVLAAVLVNGTGDPAKPEVEKLIPVGRTVDLPVGEGTMPYDVTQEDVDQVELYVDTVLTAVAEAGRTAIYGAEVPLTRLAELHPDLGGTADFVLLDPAASVLKVFDLKTGYMRVDPYENKQVLLYAIGAYMAFCERSAERADPVPVDHIEVYIVQGLEVRGPWRVDVEEMMERALQLANAAEQTRAVDAELVPGDWCRYCPAVEHCPALHRTAGELTFSGPLDRPLRRDVADMTPEDVARYLDLETAVTSFFERVRARAEHLLMLGVPVPGYTRVPLRANWAWKDELMAPAALRGLGLSEQDIYETRLRSPAQVRNVLKSRAPRRKRGEPKPTDPLDGIVVNTTAGRYRIGKAKDGDTASSGLIGGIELPMVGAVHED